MTNQRQIEFNRRNATKSTGPRTGNGKSVFKLNAVKHGLTAERVVIPGEDPAEFEELKRELEHELEPEGCQECDLVETIAMGMWRRRRIHRMEADILTCEQAAKEHHLAERDYADCSKAFQRYRRNSKRRTNAREDGYELENDENDENENFDNNGVEFDYLAAKTRFDEAKRNYDEIYRGLRVFS